MAGSPEKSFLVSESIQRHNLSARLAFETFHNSLLARALGGRQTNYLATKGRIRMSAVVRLTTKNFSNHSTQQQEFCDKLTHDMFGNV